MNKKSCYRNPAPMWAEPINDAALRHQPVKVTHRWYMDGVKVREEIYDPHKLRRPQKKATLTYKVAFSFHNIYTLLEIASP